MAYDPPIYRVPTDWRIPTNSEFFVKDRTPPSKRPLCAGCEKNRVQKGKPLCWDCQHKREGQLG